MTPDSRSHAGGSGEGAPAEALVAPSSRNPFRVLARHRNYRIFWIGQTLSLVGSWMQTMAIGWLSLELSNSAFVVGLVASVGAIPVVLLSMHAGAIVDHGNRLRLVRITQAVFLMQAAVLWGITAAGAVTIGWLLALQLAQGIASAIEIPARQSMMIELVGRDDLQPAIALNSSGFNLARIVGPALGGVVIGQLGLSWCFGLNAVSFLAVLWGLFLIRIPDARPAVALTWREAATLSTRGAIEGVQHLMQRGPVRELLLLVTVGALFGGPFLTLMPVIARDQLGLGAKGYGGSLAVLGLGGLLGALLVAGPISHRPRKGIALLTAAMAYPVLLLVFAATRQVVIAYGLLLATGIAMITFNALCNGVLQLLVEEQYRGRLMAFYSLVFIGLSQAVGSLGIGAVARAVGAPLAVALSAAVLLIGSLVAWRHAGFWRAV